MSCGERGDFTMRATDRLFARTERELGRTFLVPQPLREQALIDFVGLRHALPPTPRLRRPSDIGLHNPDELKLVDRQTAALPGWRLEGDEIIELRIIPALEVEVKRVTLDLGWNWRCRHRWREIYFCRWSEQLPPGWVLVIGPFSIARMR